jgi:aminopeptidase
MVDDGIISASDVRRGFVETSLPAGKIVTGVHTNSAEGDVRFAESVFTMGRSVKGLRLRFEKGKIVDWDADENRELLSKLLEGRRVGGNRLGWFSIGLNPVAEPFMLDNSIVRNDVAIGLGPHPILERSKATPRVQFEATIGLAKVEIVD